MNRKKKIMKCEKEEEETDNDKRERRKCKKANGKKRWKIKERKNLRALTKF